MTSPNWTFLPTPRHIEPTSARFSLTPAPVIRLDPASAGSLRPAGEKLAGAARKIGLELPIETGSPTGSGITFRISPDDMSHPQGYLVEVSSTQVAVTAHDPAGAYYAACTLAQILPQLAEPALPGMRIADWPDFPARGVMLDISRDKVYTMETLYELVERLAGWKINQLQLYTEHTFAYSRHEIVWREASPMTGDEIRALDAFCRARFIELAPNQNSFGHMERWLKHEPYAHLAETHDEFDTPWGERKKGPFSLAPLEPGSLGLVGELYDELLPHFSSGLFNVGCDETVDLGVGKSRAACQERGHGRVYLEFLLQIHRLAKQRGKTMQFWGDIVLKHPETLADIPRDVIGLIWGYEANHPFDRQAGQFAAAGIPFYVCPGNSVWNSLCGRTDNTLGNLRSAAVHGLKHGAIGYLTTDWGDNGHWQTFPISFLGLAAGAALSWCGDSIMEVPIQPVLSRLVFEDPSCSMGHFLYDLGNADHSADAALPGIEGYFWPLHNTLALTRVRPNTSAQMYRNGLARVRELREQYLGRDQMQRPDAALIRRELALTLRMMEHACRRALLAFGEAAPDGLGKDMEEIAEEYRWIWLQRARPGGLKDSLARLRRCESDYAR